MTPEELERCSRQELIDVILVLARILKEEDSIIEQNGIPLHSKKLEDLKRGLFS